MPLDTILLSRIQDNDPLLTNLDIAYVELAPDEKEKLFLCLEYNKHITDINISGHALSVKNIESLNHVVQLTSLKAAECDLGGEEVALLAQHPSLTSINLCANKLNDENVAKLLEKQGLTYLNLSDNHLTVKSALLIATNAALKTVILNYNELKAEGVKALAKSSSITTLKISGNQVGAEGVAAIASNKVLQSLDLSYNYITDESAKALAQCAQLTFLNVSYNHIGFEGAHALSKMPNLAELVIAHNLLGNTGAATLALSDSLRSLDLTGNRISFDGARALSINKLLMRLVLSSNFLADVGAIILARNSTLTELYLSNNQIGDPGAIALSDNHALRKLNLNYNKVGEKGKKALHENKMLTATVMHFSEIAPEFSDDDLNFMALLTENFLCLLDRNGIIQYANAAVVRKLQYLEDELLGSSFFDLVYYSDKDQIKRLLFDEKPQFPIQYFDSKCIAKEGGLRCVSWTTQVKHSNIYMVGIDVTAELRAAEAVKKQKERENQERLRAAEEHNLQQRNFIAYLSHEVRNPLSAIQGIQEILRDQVAVIRDILAKESELKKEKADPILEAMENELEDQLISINYQETILNDNLDIVKIGEKKLVLQKNIFDLIEIIRNVINMVYANAIKKGLQLETQLPEKVLVKGDEMRIKQIMVNLLGNAIKFTHQGKIKVELSIDEKTEKYLRASISVIDTGIGIDAPEVVGIFERFLQLRPYHDGGYHGSGLGLFIAKQLAQLMGGNITVRSERGKGSTFILTVTYDLPGPKDEYKRKKDVEISSLWAKKSGKKRRILVVDDNEINCRVLASSLGKAGYETILASSGSSAIAEFDKQVFDAILMDVVMPEMDGLEATKIIRQRELTKGLPKTPIIGVTANALEADYEQGLAAGMDDYFIKPVNPKILVEKIETLAKQRDKGETSVAIEQVSSASSFLRA